MKTKVKFLYHEKGRDLMAFFPDENYNDFSGLTKVCYSHVGQHSACCLDYANECRTATWFEYAPLKKELESIGYELEILT